MKSGPELITHYFTELTSQQRERFAQLGDLYATWNSRINVISRKDMDHFYERHVLHSLGIARVMPFANDTKVLDVGTGGGFPGIPLAILFPGAHFTLVDSIGKKIRVVEEVVNALGLKNVSALQVRAEEMKEQFHFVVSRAVTEFPKFHAWVKGKFLRENLNELDNGILYLKGGDLTEELGRFASEARIFPLSRYFPEEFFETKKVVYLNMK